MGFESGALKKKAEQPKKEEEEIELTEQDIEIVGDVGEQKTAKIIELTPAMRKNKEVPSPQELMERARKKNEELAAAAPETARDQKLQKKIDELKAHQEKLVKQHGESPLGKRIQEVTEKEIQDLKGKQIRHRAANEDIKKLRQMNAERRAQREAPPSQEVQEAMAELSEIEKQRAEEEKENERVAREVHEPGAVEASMNELREIEKQRVEEEKPEVLKSLDELRQIEKERVAEEAWQEKAKKAPREYAKEAGVIEARPMKVPEAKNEAKVEVSPTAGYTSAEEDWFKKGERISAENERAAAEAPDLSVVPKSVEARLDQIKDLDVPGLDFESFSALYRRQNSVDKMLEDDHLGKIKLGFFNKLKLKWEASRLRSKLEPLMKEVDQYESSAADEAQKRFNQMTPEEQAEWRANRRTNRRIERKRGIQKLGGKPGRPLTLKG